MGGIRVGSLTLNGNSRKSIHELFLTDVVISQILNTTNFSIHLENQIDVTFEELVKKKFSRSPEAIPLNQHDDGFIVLFRRDTDKTVFVGTEIKNDDVLFKTLKTG